MRIGLLGGRFDPPHLGHLLVAEQAREELALDEVHFVPAGAPPHKGVVAAPGARAAMTRLATEDHRAFHVDDRELQREGPSYAIDTIDEVRTERPGDELVFLIGADAYLEIADWHRAEAMVRTVEVAVVPRPGTPLAALDSLDEPFRSAATRIETVPIGISSTLLRRRAGQRRSLRYLTPLPVVRYIVEEGLYLSNPFDTEGAA